MQHTNATHLVEAFTLSTQHALLLHPASIAEKHGRQPVPKQYTLPSSTCTMLAGGPPSPDTQGHESAPKCHLTCQVRRCAMHLIHHNGPRLWITAQYACNFDHRQPMQTSAEASFCQSSAWHAARQASFHAQARSSRQLSHARRCSAVVCQFDSMQS